MNEEDNEEGDDHDTGDEEGMRSGIFVCKYK